MNAWRAAFFAALGLVAFLLLAPPDLVPAILAPHTSGEPDRELGLPPGSDKVGHVAGFALLGFLGLRAFPASGALLLLAGLVAFGLATEVAQHFVPGRTMEALDLAADLVGSLAGVALSRARSAA